MEVSGRFPESHGNEFRYRADEYQQDRVMEFLE